MATPPDSGSSSRKQKAQVMVYAADILSVEGDGIVLPTISDGLMVEKLAARIKNAAGQTVEDEARRSAPIAVGAAVVTGAGALAVRHLIHVPLTEAAAMKIGVENIRRATRAGLLAAARFQLDRVAIPGFGYGELGVPYDEAARAIIDEVQACRGTHPAIVILMDTDPEMVRAFEDQLGED